MVNLEHEQQKKIVPNLSFKTQQVYPIYHGQLKRMFPNLPWKNSVKKCINLSGIAQKGFFNPSKGTQKICHLSENLAWKAQESFPNLSRNYNINFGNLPWVTWDECFLIYLGLHRKISQLAMDNSGNFRKLPWTAQKKLRHYRRHARVCKKIVCFSPKFATN